MAATDKRASADGHAAKKARTAAAKPNLLSLLLHTKAEDFALPDAQPIFYCHRTDKVADIWKALQQRNILSVPVILKQDQGWRYFGFVDVYDIAKYLINNYGPTGDSPNFESHDWTSVFDTRDFLQTEINDIMVWPLSKKNPFHPVKEGYSAWAVLEPLAREDIHRIPVVDKDGQIVNLVTQSQVLQFLNDNIELLDSKLKRPVSSCKRFFKPVVLVQETTTAIEAFKLMVEENIGGVAVIDTHGQLVGTLSLRDIKAVNTDISNLHRLFLSTRLFLEYVNDEVYVKRPRTVAFVTQDECITKAIRLLVESRIHRVFITKDGKDKAPVGIVTASDILLEMVDV